MPSAKPSPATTNIPGALPVLPQPPPPDDDETLHDAVEASPDDDNDDDDRFVEAVSHPHPAAPTNAAPPATPPAHDHHIPRVAAAADPPPLAPPVLSTSSVLPLLSNLPATAPTAASPPPPRPRSPTTASFAAFLDEPFSSASLWGGNDGGGSTPFSMPVTVVTAAEAPDPPPVSHAASQPDAAGASGEADAKPTAGPSLLEPPTSVRGPSGPSKPAQLSIPLPFMSRSTSFPESLSWLPFRLGSAKPTAAATSPSRSASPTAASVPPDLPLPRYSADFPRPWGRRPSPARPGRANAPAASSEPPPPPPALSAGLPLVPAGTDAYELAADAIVQLRARRFDQLVQRSASRGSYHVADRDDAALDDWAARVRALGAAGRGPSIQDLYAFGHQRFRDPLLEHGLWPVADVLLTRLAWSDGVPVHTDALASVLDQSVNYLEYMQRSSAPPARPRTFGDDDEDDGEGDGSTSGALPEDLERMFPALKRLRAAIADDAPVDLDSLLVVQMMSSAPAVRRHLWGVDQIVESVEAALKGIFERYLVFVTER
ncbi:hypothetical protein HK405_015197 [Cladochytrium tenue]|nr:hypothetical protein HK405_015197 [Cladochytrium tenue]